MKTYTIHKDCVQRRFIRVENKNYLLSAYGDMKECNAVDLNPIGQLRETHEKVIVKEIGNHKNWVTATEKTIMDEMAFRKTSNERFRSQMTDVFSIPIH